MVAAVGRTRARRHVSLRPQCNRLVGGLREQHQSDRPGAFVGPTGGTRPRPAARSAREFYLGQLTVSFSGYALPTASTTAQLSTPRTGSEVQGLPYQWSEAGVSQNTYGTDTAVADGSGNLLSLFPLDFVDSINPYYAGRADLSRFRSAARGSWPAAACR